MGIKILLISAAFYPQSSPRSTRTTSLAIEFAKEGHEVTVLIPNKDQVHTEFEQKYGLIIKDLGKRRFKAIDINSRNKFYRLLKRFVRRALLQLLDYPNIEFMFKLKKAINEESKDFDLLISIAAPHSIHWGTAWACRNKLPIAKKWVADCGDPFMGVTTDRFRKPFYFEFIEKFWCRKADYITVPFDGAIKGYYPEFRNKIKVIPQGIDFDEIKINPKDYSINLIPTFAYAGLLIPGSRDPSLLIAYLLSLDCDFKFIFYTGSQGMLQKFVERSAGKIEIREFIPRNELIPILSKMDFVINFDNGVSTQLPSKLIDYYLTKRPVLSIDSYSFDKQIINEFLKGNYSNRYEYKDQDKYKIENVCNQFLTVME